MEYWGTDKGPSHRRDAYAWELGYAVGYPEDHPNGGRKKVERLKALIKENWEAMSPAEKADAERLHGPINTEGFTAQLAALVRRPGY